MNGFWTGRGRLAMGLAAVLLVSLAGCEPKEKAGSSGTPEQGGPDVAGSVPGATPPVPEPVVRSEPSEVDPSLTPTPAPEPARPALTKEPWTLKHAGFAAHLPADVDFYADARELGWLWELVEQSGLNGKLDELFGAAEMQFTLPEGAPREGWETLSRMMAGEAFVAVRGLATVVEAAGEISAEMNRVVGRDMTTAIAGADFFEMADDEFGADAQEEIAKWMLRNVKKVEAEKNLAVYAGGRVPDDKRAALVERLVGQLQGLASGSEVVKPVRWQRGEVSWAGVEVRIGDIEGFGAAEAPVDMDAQGWEELKEAVGNWKLTVAGAEAGGFVVVGVGLGQEAIKLAEGPEQSLAAIDAYQFFREFDAKAVYATTWMSKATVGGAWKWNSYLPLFEGVAEGLKAAPNLALKAAMGKAVAELNDRWRARRSGVAHDLLSAVVIEEGVRVESRGGWLNAGLDLVSPLKFGKAFDAIGEKLFVRAHWKREAAHIALGKKWAEAATKFVRLVAEEAMDAGLETAREGNDEEAIANLTRWKRDLLKGIDDLWEGYDEHFSHAFGTESAFVMDLEGKMIPALGVEPEEVEEGRIPRAAYLRPIVKREALTESWTLWQRASTNMFGILAEAVDQPIPFPDTMTAEKDDLRTYFFPFPFASDDFLPSVSVSDELYILGSSKTLSESLYGTWREADEEVDEPGVTVALNTDPLWSFCAVWLDLLEKRRAAMEEFEGRELEPLTEKEQDHLHLDDEGLGELDPETRRSLEELLQDPEIPEGVRKSLREELEDDSSPDADPRPLQEVPEEAAPEQAPPAREKEGPAREPHEHEHEHEPAPEDAGNEAEEEVEPGRELIEADAIDFSELGLAGEDELMLGPEDEVPMAPGLFGFEALLSDPATLRALLEKARWFRGFTYHRRLEDGVPRSTMKVRWEAP